MESDAGMKSFETDDEKCLRKLPYFHRIQNQADKDLIGDFTPKLVSSDETVVPGSNSASSSATWNTANTWEERDCSEWSQRKISDIFESDFEILNDGFRVELTAIGEFHITMFANLLSLPFRCDYRDVIKDFKTVRDDYIKI